MKLTRKVNASLVSALSSPALHVRHTFLSINEDELNAVLCCLINEAYQDQCTIGWRHLASSAAVSLEDVKTSYLTLLLRTKSRTCTPFLFV